MLHCLMRGGEPGTCPRTPFSHKTGLCWSHFKWADEATGKPATTKGKDGLWYYILTIMVYAIKDTNATHQRVPTVIRSKHPTGQTLWDITCPYTAIRRSWCQRLHKVKGEEKTSPFFVTNKNEPVNTDLILILIREAVTALEMNPELFGSSALRRGGATDLRDELGSLAAKELIKQRGRWATDIYDI